MSNRPGTSRSVIELDLRHPVVVLPVEPDEAEDAEAAA